MKKSTVVKEILKNSSHGSFVNVNGGYAFAPANIALVKYWGKRNQELNLPITSSFSVSLGQKGTFTRILEIPNDFDNFIVNNEAIDLESDFAKRLTEFLDLFRPKPTTKYLVDTISTVPIAAGFASSASGFAALVQALNHLYDWQLDKTKLSILARLGSGSAARSLWNGFVEWQKGEDPLGMDSYGKPFDFVWQDLRIGALTISAQKKKISSRDAMAKCVETSTVYGSWPTQVEEDLILIKEAIHEKNFKLFGETAEKNALKMHEIMLNAKPSISYILPKTVEARKKIKSLREDGTPVYFTEDAGPNLQLLFLKESEEKIIKVFPKIEIVAPFYDFTKEQVILVNEKDVEIGIEEKIVAHLQGKLHRAFSVFVLRNNHGKIEVLLQKRHRDKYHSGGLWSNTCCGHPKPNEEIKLAAMRRLQEEMGITAKKLEFKNKFYYKALFPEIGMAENEIDYVFVEFLDAGNLNTEPKINPTEVENYKWVELESLKKDALENPKLYTAWFLQAVSCVKS